MTLWGKINGIVTNCNSPTINILTMIYIPSICIKYSFYALQNDSLKANCADFFIFSYETRIVPAFVFHFSFFL